MVLHGVDTAQSMYRMGQGTHRELNPVLRPLAHQPALFGAAKFGLATGLNWLYLTHHARHPRLVTWMVIVQNLALTAVVAHNARIGTTH